MVVFSLNTTRLELIILDAASILLTRHAGAAARDECRDGGAGMHLCKCADAADIDKKLQPPREAASTSSARRGGP